MKKIIILGGVVIEIDAERELYIADSTIPFLCEGEEPEVNVKVTWEWDSFYYPKTRLIGEDLLQKYYFDHNFLASTVGQSSFLCFHRVKF